MSKYTTTLNKIKDHSPCASSWKLLLRTLGKTKADDEPLLFSKILEILGRKDAIWCMRSAPNFAKEWRLFSVFCARGIVHLMRDSRSICAINVAERFAHGMAIREELNLVRGDAHDAYVSAYAAYVSASEASEAYDTYDTYDAYAAYAAYAAYLTSDASNAAYAAYVTSDASNADIKNQLKYLTELFSS